MLSNVRLARNKKISQMFNAFLLSNREAGRKNQEHQRCYDARTDPASKRKDRAIPDK